MPTTVPRRPSQATYPHESTLGCRVGAAETIWVNACAKHEPIDGRVVTEYEERLHISCRGFAQQQRASHSWPRTTHHPSSLHSSCRTVSALYWRLSLHDGDAPPCFGHGTSTASLVAASSSKGKPDRLVPPFPPPVAVVVAKGGTWQFRNHQIAPTRGRSFHHSSLWSPGSSRRSGGTRRHWVLGTRAKPGHHS